MLTNICEFNSDRFLIWEFFIYIFTCQTNSTSLSITSESKKPIFYFLLVFYEQSERNSNWASHKFMIWGLKTGMFKFVSTVSCRGGA